MQESRKTHLDRDFLDLLLFALLCLIITQVELPEETLSSFSC